MAYARDAPAMFTAVIHARGCVCRQGSYRLFAQVLRTWVILRNRMFKWICRLSITFLPRVGLLATQVEATLTQMFARRPPAKNFQLAIVGGGIGGVILALGLLRRNVPVRIYEAASGFREVGLGLSIGPAAYRAIPLIDPRIRDIYDSLITTHADSPGYEQYHRTWFEIVRATGSNAGKVIFDLKAFPSGQTSVRRSDFLDSLMCLLPPEAFRLGKRLETFRETEDGIKMFFKDGTSAWADAVIGCDGIHSKVRECMLPEESDRSAPQYSGMYGYRAVLNMMDMIEAVGEHRARVATIYAGQGSYAVTYPIMRAKKVNVGLFIIKPSWNCNTWVRPAEKSEMHRDFDHMGEHVKAIMEVGKICGIMAHKVD